MKDIKLADLASEDRPPVVKRLYQIRDMKSKISAGPIIDDWNDVAMRRDLENAVNKADGSHLNKWPEDYALYHVGYQEQLTGMIEPCIPVLIVRGDELVRRPNPT